MITFVFIYNAEKNFLFYFFRKISPVFAHRYNRHPIPLPALDCGGYAPYGHEH